ncbi:hypothetical protein C5D07_00845 [Rathayibacter tritici]|nr:hypothetical protein C5C06_06120 [Rathayibacter tritici]PPI19917.1 hypothetical protein C5D07_00845 [Rathayibacter tritici]
MSSTPSRRSAPRRSVSTPVFAIAGPAPEPTATPTVLLVEPTSEVLAQPGAALAHTGVARTTGLAAPALTLLARGEGAVVVTVRHESAHR